MKKTILFKFLNWVLFLAFIPAVLLPSNAHPAQVTLAWDASTDQAVFGYKVYYGTASGSYSGSIDVGNTATHTVTNLQDGVTYYFAATAYDTSRVESGYSSEVVYSVAPSCIYSLSPTSQSFGSAGGTGSVSLSTGSGCPWTAVSNATWIILTSNSSGTGSTAVNYSTSANTSASSRTGTLTVAGKAFTLNQQGAVSQYTLTLNRAGTGSGAVATQPTGTTFAQGTVVILTASTDPSSEFAGWTGSCAGTSPTCSLTMNSNKSVTATFNRKVFTINASAGVNGVISPQGAVSVSYGASQSFMITPAAGYRASDVKVDGVSVGAVTSFQFGNLIANHTIAASFAATQATNPTPFLLGLNAGGTQYTTGGGILYQADKYFSGGTSRKVYASIIGTADPSLYRAERYGNFSYAIPLAKGNYEVILEFAELTWSSRGRRIFDVYMEGKRVLTGLDLYAVAKKNTAYDLSLVASVADGVLNINFIPRTGQATISAILIRALPGS